MKGLKRKNLYWHTFAKEKNLEKPNVKLPESSARVAGLRLLSSSYAIVTALLFLAMALLKTRTD
jgi:hypothetical protein